MKYNMSSIMKMAWKIYRENDAIDFRTALKDSWECAKATAVKDKERKLLNETINRGIKLLSLRRDRKDLQKSIGEYPRMYSEFRESDEVKPDWIAIMTEWAEDDIAKIDVQMKNF